MKLSNENITLVEQLSDELSKQYEKNKITLTVFDVLEYGDEALIKVMRNVNTHRILNKTLSKEDYSKFADTIYDKFNNKETV